MPSVSLSTTGGIGGILGLSTDGILYAPPAAVAVGVVPDVVGEDGGWKVEVSGLFPINTDFYATVIFLYGPGSLIALRGNSGVPGSREVVQSTDGSTLSFYVPPQPEGPAPLLIILTIASLDGVFSTSIVNPFTYLHRNYTTNLYSLRSAFPPPREVGPYSIEDEEY